MVTACACNSQLVASSLYDQSYAAVSLPPDRVYDRLVLDVKHANNVVNLYLVIVFRIFNSYKIK